MGRSTPPQFTSRARIADTTLDVSPMNRLHQIIYILRGRPLLGRCFRGSTLVPRFALRNAYTFHSDEERTAGRCRLSATYSPQRTFGQVVLVLYQIWTASVLSSSCFGVACVLALNRN